MITISNLLVDSEEQSAGLNYQPNSRFLGNVRVTAGRYYLIAFSLKTSTQTMPVLMSTYSEGGLTVNPITQTIINTATPISPTYPKLTNVYKSIGFYLYGGYCTSSNANWGLTVTFGRCDYSSFAYSVDEVQGSISSPILRPIAVKTNSGVLAPITPGNVTYLAGMSMVPNQSYPTVIAPSWLKLSGCHDESIVPNLLTGYSSVGDLAPGWSDVGGSGQPGPYLEKALIACEIVAA